MATSRYRPPLSNNLYGFFVELRPFLSPAFVVPPRVPGNGCLPLLRFEDGRPGFALLISNSVSGTLGQLFLQLISFPPKKLPPELLCLSMDVLGRHSTKVT
jgi:hypothetical protein